MRSSISLGMLVFLCSVSLVVGKWSRLQSQALPADIFSMPLGYQYGIEYKPKIVIQNGVTLADTSYGVQNPGLGKSIRCFGVAWDQLYHAGVDLYRADGTSTDEDEVSAAANGEIVFAKDVQHASADWRRAFLPFVSGQAAVVSSAQGQAGQRLLTPGAFATPSLARARHALATRLPRPDRLGVSHRFHHRQHSPPYSLPLGKHVSS